MQKSKTLSFIFAITSIVLISWTIFVVAAQNGVFINKDTPWMSDSPSLVGVTKDFDYYNISLAFSSINYSRELQNIIINPHSEEAVNGLFGYINGTTVKGPNPVFRSFIETGDNLQVNLMVPCEAFNSGTTIELQVFGAGFGCAGTILFP